MIIHEKEQNSDVFNNIYMSESKPLRNSKIINTNYFLNILFLP